LSATLFRFLPDKELLLLGLWGCEQAQLVQAPVVKAKPLSIRYGKASNLEEKYSNI